MAKLSAAQRRNLTSDDYAVPGKKKLPIHDKNHVKMAWDELGKTKDLTASERKEARTRILAAAKKMDMDTTGWKGVMNDSSDEFVFNDLFIGKPQVLEDSSEASDGKMRLRFQVTKSNVVNTNRRLYPDPILDDALNRSNERIKENRMVGESPHPKHYLAKDGSVVFDSRLENNVVKWTNQFKDENGVVFADCVVLDTRLGKDLKACVDEGIPVGVSMRSLGDSIRKQIGGAMVDVATRMEILTYDIVMNPATDGCEIVQVLTDSQIDAALNEQQVFDDNIEITAPDCPNCGSKLTAMDPDNDGDLDFYACDNCNEAFIPEESRTVRTVVVQSLNSMPNDPDWDGYSLARQWMVSRNKTGTVTTDSAQEGDDQVDIKELMAQLKTDPEFQAMVDAAAEAKARVIAQPALDNVEAQKQAAAVAEARQKTKVFVDSKIGELKGKVQDDVLSVIADSVKDSTDETQAGAIIDAAVAAYSKASAKVQLDSVGFNEAGAAQAGGQGHVRVQVVNETAPHAKFMREMMDSFDRIADEKGHERDASIRKVNQGFIDKVIKHHEERIASEKGMGAFTDSAAFLDSTVVNNDSVSVTTTQLLNQPVISQLLLIEAFQDVECLQFLASETFDGDEIRYPVETFTSAAVINPATGIPDLLVGEGDGISESEINLGWITFNPDWRRNAISLSTDVIRTLQSGPAKYDAVARALYNIAYEKRRITDRIGYLEMTMAADEYQPTAVASETIAAAQLSAGASGTNVTYVGQLTVNGTATATAGANPVVRPRTKRQHLPGGAVQTTTSNAFTVKVSGTTLTMGYLDANGNIQSGDYAVDFENGLVYFASSSNVNPTASPAVLPVVTYSAVTNYTTWHSTVPSGKDADAYYNTLLQLITGQRAVMKSAPRFQAPNLGIMSDNVAAFIENASMWYKLNSPDIGNLSGLADSTYFGNRSGVNFARINAPTVFGDGRILLTQKGATRYGVETPYQIEGPYPKYDANQRIIDAKLYYGRENSVFCTPQVVDTTGAIINPKSRSIKIVS